MANVPPTKLATTEEGQGELTLADGFAMFPWLGTIRAATKLNGSRGVWFEKTFNFEVFRFSTAATHSAFVGICGPSYAVEMDTDASTSYTIPDPGSPSAGTLVLGDHAIRGGFQFGADFGIAIELELDANFVVARKRLVSVDANVDVDLLELLVDLLMQLLSGGGGGQAEGNPNDLETSEITGTDSDAPEIEEGQRSGDPHGGKGKFTATGMVDFIPKPWQPPPGGPQQGPPSATLVPNIAWGFSIVPLFAEIPGLDVLYALDEALEAIGGGFELGPGVTIGLPTKVTLKGATISNHPFDVTDVSASGSDPDATTSATLEERLPVSPNLQPLTDTPDEIGALLEHQVGFQLGIYFFVEFSFFKVCHVGARTGTLPLIFTQNLPAGAGGPFENQLSFIPGGGPVPFDAPEAAPTVGAYTANQPQGSWQGGVQARYGVSFFSDDYESPIGPFTDFDPQKRFFAFPQLGGIPVGPVVSGDEQIAGRRIYRQFDDGSEPKLVGTIDDNVTTTFTDTTP